MMKAPKVIIHNTYVVDARDGARTMAPKPRGAFVGYLLGWLWFVVIVALLVDALWLGERWSEAFADWCCRPWTGWPWDFPR